ncbi:UNVERIFIED_CONTAM: hypothetical protein FKN15_024995 [Acipenser sinensis]
MKSNVNCVEVQLRACRILQLLFVAVLEHSMEEEWMSNEKVISTVLDVVRTHSTNQELLALALNVLMILSGNELAAFRVLLPPAGTNGLQVVAEVYRYHTDDTEVVENICSLFYELVQYGR